MTQFTLNTVGTTHCTRSLTGQAMFSVNPGIPAADALEQASLLQDCANKLMSEVAFGEPPSHAALSAVYLSEMAKALMDDVAQAMGATP